MKARAISAPRGSSGEARAHGTRSGSMPMDAQRFGFAVKDDLVGAIQRSRFVRDQRAAWQGMFGEAVFSAQPNLEAGHPPAQRSDAPVQRRTEWGTVGTDIRDAAGVASKIGKDTADTVHRYVWAGKDSPGATFDES